MALAAPAVAQDAPPSPGDTMRLYQRLDGWVRAWQVPSDGGGEAEVKDLSAIAVTLRYEGAIVGRGVDIVPAGGSGVRSLVLAAGQAMSEADSRLPIERDALFEEHVRAAAERITISLELAGPMVPITPAEWTDAALGLAPGIDGVAARIGERSAAIFPGAMLVSGMDPGRALAAAVSKATGDPTLILKRPSELSTEVGAVYYRFRATHLAQPRPDKGPLFLHRAGHVVETRDLTEAELRRWADGLAQNLMGRQWPGVEKYGLQGAYDPVKGVYETPFAGPAEQAAAALALVEYAGTPGVDPGAAERAREFAAGVLSALGSVESGEIDAVSVPAARAMAWVAISELTRAHPEAATALTPDLRAFFERCDGGFQEALGEGRGVEGALGTWALARRCAARRERLEGVEARLRSTYADTPPGQLAAVMPWLGWAELAWAQIGPDGQNGAAPIPAAVALREMRTQVWSHQLRHEDLPWDQRDLAGGIVFTAARNPLPTWQSVRPLSFIATMLGDLRLTDASEAPGELARLLASLRFLRQLSAGEAEGYAYADPRRAMWGVRASLWDHRQPVEATAMTLMTVCETLRSLGAVKAGRR